LICRRRIKGCGIEKIILLQVDMEHAQQ